ncbi:dienelactone hydrolase [Kribbella sandramycini]|uniref:Dienelactone hydrolase n=1 Tax=Kribbella sandramycini TaxID=60450 RepID=A0A7Y4L5R8_9ACTN|nr:dienelactone hydrolase [Kribbella sandramycini]NOL44818.1 dienelactone hydrolase [Kribbella sandramycini]
MTEIVLFHHAQGLTDGVLAFAEQLRQAGHTVHTPDQYEGNTYATLEEGIGYAQETGFGTLLERALKAAEGYPSEVVYAGFSLGVMPAQQLTQTRPGARGGLFYYSVLPYTEFGETWPQGVPAQIHAKEEDEFYLEDAEGAQQLIAATDDVELFLYPGKEHLFADSSLPSYDEAAAQLLLTRSLTFLERL